MKARIKPLKGKYYGTEVEVETDASQLEYISIWIMGDYQPSIREYDFVEDGKYMVFDEELQEAFEYEICDSHYETVTSYKIAQAIVKALGEL